MNNQRVSLKLSQIRSHYQGQFTQQMIHYYENQQAGFIVYVCIYIPYAKYISL